MHVVQIVAKVSADSNKTNLISVGYVVIVEAKFDLNKK